MRYDPQQYRRKQRKSRTRFDVAMTQRAQRRQPVRLPRVSGVLLMAVLVVVGIAAIGAWFFGGDWRVTADKIEVQNNGGVPVEAIIGASGITGEHFQFVDLQAAAKRVDDLPGVEAAQINCHWMWKTDCAILVQPARAMVLWETAGGNLWNDYEGKVQRAADAVPAKVRVLVEDGDPPVAGQPLDGRMLRALNELIATQPDVTRYTYSKAHGLSWTSADGVKVRLGWAEYDGAMSEKLALAKAIEQQLNAQETKVKVLDVRFVQAPYYIK